VLMHLMFAVASTLMQRHSEERPVEALVEAPFAPPSGRPVTESVGVGCTDASLPFCIPAHEVRDQSFV
jgi:hypothetical protein